MRFDIMTLFPDLVNTVLGESIIGRAQKSGAIEIECHNIRDFSKDKHRRVDDTPYGGGKGMLMMAPPIFSCYDNIIKNHGDTDKKTRVQIPAAYTAPADIISNRRRSIPANFSAFPAIGSPS